MAVLTNVSVTVGDLYKAYPDIKNRQFEEQVSFQDVISDAKDIVYNQIKSQKRDEYSNYSEADYVTLLEKIKDFTDGTPLKKKILAYAVSTIYKQNGMYDDALIYKNDADGLPLMFYLDSDSDSTVDIGERENLPVVVVGR